MSRFDFAIVGSRHGRSPHYRRAGTAWPGAAAQAEEQPGYHATGRSAAFWTESYGGPLVQPLTWHRGFFDDHGLLAPRGALTLARAEDADGLTGFVDEFSALGCGLIRLTARH